MSTTSSTTTPSKIPIKTTHYPSENTNPNLPTPSQKPIKTPLPKSSSKPKKLIIPPPPQRHQQRKFIVAKKKKMKTDPRNPEVDPNKAREAAYEALRASHDEFFKKDLEGSRSEEEKEKVKSLVMEEALSCIPEPGSGRVRHLVKAFEGLLRVSGGESGRTGEGRSRVMNWALPRLREQIMMKDFESENDGGVGEAEGGSCSVFSFGELERDPRLCSSVDSNSGDRLSLGSRTSNGSRRSRRNSLDSSSRSWDRKLRVTSQQPFKLRTEQRGRMKEENFIKKVKEMFMEEEKKRIPIAQGLPWTTDEPECLVKPPVKESTEPIDLVLHSDVRAVERAEFDNYVAERLSFIEQIRLENERQQKLEEEEELKRLRRELVPKAQPMPYFDRPFVPKKSNRPRTVPKEPRFHLKPMKSSCVSLVGR